ncbi:hypothetical protein GW915_00455 [bacterium]|nr:hypothetical protein [bacterium]
MEENLVKMIVYGIVGGLIAWCSGLILKKMGYNALAPGENEKNRRGLILVAVVLIILVALPFCYNYSCDDTCRGAIAKWLSD